MPDPVEFPIVRRAFDRTVRLVTTARLRDAVLKALGDDEHLDDLAEIEGATSGRLQAQELGTDSIDPREFIVGVPHAHFINAAFAYPRPGELNRFNGPGRGAWYAALKVDTAIAEVSFHITRELERVNEFNTVVEYAEMYASFAGEFVDLRGANPRPSCLDPDPTIGYPAGNALADSTRARGSNGIIYPSVRDPEGTCLVALFPHAVQSVAQGEVIRMTWSGSPNPTVQPVP